MFGLRTVPRGRLTTRGAPRGGRPPAAPGSSPSSAGSEPDEPGRGLEVRCDDARSAVRGDPLALDVLERSLDGLAEPLADPLRVAGDLQAGQRPVLVASR